MNTDVEQHRAGLLRTARTLVAARSTETDMANAAAEVLTEVLGGGCVIRLASPDHAWLDAAAIRSADPQHQRFIEAVVAAGGRQPSDAGLNGAVFSSGRTVAMGEIDVEDYRLLLQPEFWPVLDRYRIVSTIAVPLRGAHDILGTLTVAHFDSPTLFTDDAQTFVEALAGVVAASIERARRIERGDDEARIRRVSMFCERGNERPFLVWVDGRIYYSDWTTREALRHFVPHVEWDTALTDPAEVIETFTAAFTFMGITPEVRLA